MLTMNMFSRRNFLGGCLALGAMPTMRTFAMGVGRRQLLKLGVLSDVHLHAPGDETTLRTALEFFRERGVDGVLIAGDMANTGRRSQLARIAGEWFAVFPEGKYPDGKKCEQLFVLGNHCMEAWTWNKKESEDADFRKNEAIGFEENVAKFWEELFHEKYSPVWIKKVNGCAIVGAHWGSWKLPGWSLEEFLEKHKDEINPSLPFIYTQHDHPGGTVMGAWAWGHDRGRSTKTLAKFPNCVAFSGHSHYSLTDERSVWQGDFTSINTSSLKYSSRDYSLRENCPGNGEWGYNGEKRKHIPGWIGTDDGRQGQVVTFYPDHLEIERREFVHGNKSLGPDWIVPFPAANAPEMTFAARAAKRTAPEFAADAKVSFKEIEFQNRKCVEVTFPAAKTIDGCRPYEYEVTAVLLADDVDLVQAQRRVMAEGFYLPEELADKPSKCAFAYDELPCKGQYRFEVRPIECFGRKGRPIRGEIKVG